MDLDERILELSRYGYSCGQILALLLLETIGEENPQLVRCMQGLNGGIGSSGGNLMDFAGSTPGRTHICGIRE